MMASTHLLNLNVVAQNVTLKKRRLYLKFPARQDNKYKNKIIIEMFKCMIKMTIC